MLTECVTKQFKVRTGIWRHKFYVRKVNIAALAPGGET